MGIVKSVKQTVGAVVGKVTGKKPVTGGDTKALQREAGTVTVPESYKGTTGTKVGGGGDTVALQKQTPQTITKAVETSAGARPRSQTSLTHQTNTGFNPATRVQEGYTPQQVTQAVERSATYTSPVSATGTQLRGGNLPLPLGMNFPKKEDRPSSIEFKRDVLGKSGFFYALPYASQQLEKGAYKVPVVKSFADYTGLSKPAPQWLQDFTYQLPLMAFTPLIPTSTEFASGLATGRNVLGGGLSPTRETNFISKVRPLNEDTSVVVTKSVTRIGGGVDVKGLNVNIIKTVDTKYAGLGYGASGLRVRSGTSMYSAGKEVTAGRELFEAPTYKVTATGSLFKQTMAKTIKGGKTISTKPSSEVMTTKALGVSTKVGDEGITLYKGITDYGTDVRGIIYQPKSPISEPSSSFISKVSTKTVTKTISGQVASQSQVASNLIKAVPKATPSIFTIPSIVGVKAVEVVKNIKPTITGRVSADLVTEQKLKIAPITTATTATDLATASKPIAITGVKAIPRTVTAPRQTPIPAITPITTPTLKQPAPQKTETTRSPISPIIPIVNIPTPSTPIIPPFNIPSFDSGKSSVRIISGKRKYGYTPDFRSIALGIRGKAPKKLGSFGYGEQARPIASNSKGGFFKNLDNKIKLNLKTKSKSIIRRIRRR